MGEPQVPATFERSGNPARRPQGKTKSFGVPQAARIQKFSPDQRLSMQKKRQDFLPLLVCGKALGVDINPLRGV